MSNLATNNAKYVSIIPENQQTYKPGQKIVYNLEPSLGYLKGRDSYLVFDILMASATQTRFTLGPAGISSIIKQVFIYSKQSGILLETLDNYNQWVHMESQYRHDDYNNISTSKVSQVDFVALRSALDHDPGELRHQQHVCRRHQQQTHADPGCQHCRRLRQVGADQRSLLLPLKVGDFPALG